MNPFRLELECEGVMSWRDFTLFWASSVCGPFRLRLADRDRARRYGLPMFVSYNADLLTLEGVLVIEVLLAADHERTAAELFEQLFSDVVIGGLFPRRFPVPAPGGEPGIKVAPTIMAVPRKVTKISILEQLAKV